MRFYIKTNYQELTRRWFFWKRYNVELISIAILADKEGAEPLYLVSDEFTTFLSDLHTREDIIALLPNRQGMQWQSLTRIRNKISEYIDINAGEEEQVEIVGHSCSMDFVLFASLFGGVKSKAWPRKLPKRAIDLSQSIDEFVAGMQDANFGFDSEYTLFIPKEDGVPYTFNAKMRMFESHVDYQQKSKAHVQAPSYEVRYIAWMDGFLKIIKFLSHLNQIL